jgi:decaprenylphospho-beta-D-erythro-pentofuranosid-2-ulose 2-reductase
MKKPVLILGAASDMARAIARSFAAEGHAIQLAARNVERLEADRADLVTRYGVEVTLHEFDALDLDGHAVSSPACPTCPHRRLRRGRHGHAGGKRGRPHSRYR